MIAGIPYSQWVFSMVRSSEKPDMGFEYKEKVKGPDEAASDDEG